MGTKMYTMYCSTVRNAHFGTARMSLLTVSMLLETLSSLENVEDIKRRLQKQLAIETSRPTNFYPLLFILKNRNPHIRYTSHPTTH
jgi:hypothetical protein